MTKPKKVGRPKKEGQAPQKDYHKEPREAFHLPATMQEALEAYTASLRPQTKKSAVLRMALEELLVRAGFWPWPREQGKGQ